MTMSVEELSSAESNTDLLTKKVPPEIKSEADIPFSDIETEQYSDAVSTASAKDIAKMEKEAETAKTLLDMLMRINGFKLLLHCLLALLGLYAVDVVLINTGLKNSEL